VADTFNNRVKGFDPSGSLIFNTNTDLNQPRSLFIINSPFLNASSLNVTNSGNGNLGFYRSDGQNFELSGSFSQPRSSEESAITSARVFTNGTFRDGLFSAQPVRTNSGITRTIRSVSTFDTVRLPDNSITLDLVFDQVSSNLYASDFVNNVVYQIDNAGNLSTLIGSGLNQPSYLAINGDNLYISDTGSGNILEFQLRTTPIPFEFNPTLGLAVIGGFVVARKLIKRK
jgi:hypothetical protein